MTIDADTTEGTEARYCVTLCDLTTDEVIHQVMCSTRRHAEAVQASMNRRAACRPVGAFIECLDD